MEAEYINNRDAQNKQKERLALYQQKIEQNRRLKAYQDGIEYIMGGPEYEVCDLSEIRPLIENMKDGEIITIDLMGDENEA